MAERDHTAYITVGRIGAPYGVRGWVKVHSYTESPENILAYEPWYLRPADKPNAPWQVADVEEARDHGKGVVAKFEGCNDRDAAALLRGMDIAIQRAQLPPAEAGEFYWVDLVGLRVVTLDGTELGTVDHLMETGANDVLVVKGERERLIPYVMETIVRDVDLDAGIIRVDWEADY
jgi:16S rRNA processing protein RimM